MIINWSSQDLERIFSGLSRIRKQTASKSYLEYRRNLLPYAIWVQNNLPLKKLENLITTYTHYIEEVEQGAEHSKTQGKPLKPPIWWKELRQQSNREDLVSILRTMPERHYSSWSLKPIKAYVEGMRNLNSYPSSNIFYNAIWQEIGPLTLLFWAQDKDWGYHTYTKKLWKTLPWRIRFKIMAVNLRLERVESIKISRLCIISLLKSSMGPIPTPVFPVSQKPEIFSEDSFRHIRTKCTPNNDSMKKIKRIIMHTGVSHQKSECFY